MAVPFLKGNTRPYCSNAWPGATVSLESERRIRISGSRFRSRCVHKRRHIRRRIRAIGSYRKPLCGQALRLRDDPVNDMVNFMAVHGYPAESTTGLMTAVKLKYAAIREERVNSLLSCPHHRRRGQCDPRRVEPYDLCGLPAGHD